MRFKRCLRLTLLGLLLTTPAASQQVSMPPPPGTTAILCAYNSPLPAAATTGNVQFVQCDSQGRFIVGPGTPMTITNATSTALEAARAAKATPGSLFGFYCTSIVGGSSGFCIGYNDTACPANGAAVTVAKVLDVCTFDSSNKGCSLARPYGPRPYSIGISICMTTGANAFTTPMVSNVDTGFISVDYQ